MLLFAGEKVSFLLSPPVFVRVKVSDLFRNALLSTIGVEFPPPPPLPIVVPGVGPLL